MIYEIFVNILSDKLYDKIKGWIDKKSISEFIETLKQMTLEFELKNDGAVIVSSQFANYMKYYNVLLKVMEHVLQPYISQVPKLTFLGDMTENIITYCVGNGYKLQASDKGLINDFVEMIYTTVEDFAKDKINSEDRYLIYTVIQTKGSIELQLQEMEGRFSGRLKEIKNELQDIRKDLYDDEIMLKFTNEWFEEQNRIAIKNLGDRYLPEINVTLEVNNVFDGIARNDVFENRFILYANEALISLNNIKDEEVSKCANKLTEIVGNIPFHSMEEFDFNLISCLLNEVIEKLENMEKIIREKSIPDADYKLYNIRQVYSKITDFMEYIESPEITLFNNPMLLIQGEGGIGKSHLIADIVYNRCQENKKSILLLGQQFNASDEPWKQIENLLGLNISTEKLLDSLNIIGQNQNSRLIIFIDAINEGGGKTLWPNYLAGIIEKIKKYKYIGLVLTIRTTYLDSIIGDNKFLKDYLTKITHYGFRNVEYIAMKKFFEFYKIKQPSVPFMNPEFSNPLFLLLFCKSAEKNTEIISGISITKVFDNYIKKVNLNLAQRYNYYEYINFIKNVIDEIIRYRISTNYLTNYIKIDKIIELIIQTQKKYNIEGNIIEGLISEGILTKSISYDGEDYIYVTYEKLEEHMLASYMLENLSVDNIKGLLEEGKTGSRQGIIEALAIEAPEKIDMEIFEIFPDAAKRHNIITAFINSLHWRKENSIKEKVFNYINQDDFRRKSTFEDLWRTIILLSIRPTHLFNAWRTHKTLYSIEMPIRDAIFIPLFNKIYSDDKSSINRLIDWAMLDEDKEQTSDTVIECAAIMLSWFLFTSNREFRDKCTKAIINLLTHRFSAVINLLTMFKDIDDPYIRERIYAIAYGYAVKETDSENLRKLSMFVYEEVFNKDEIYPHILLRDYARNIIEYTLYTGVKLEIEISKIKPPYKSTFPSIPSDDDIKKYKFDTNSKDFKDYYWSQNHILSSMKVEYSREGNPGGYGDFGRYTFQSYFYHWKQLHPMDLKNIAIKRIFDLGYDAEKHGKYDREVLQRRSYSRFFEFNERIGKKYQWIALHELAAQVSDNYKMDAPWSWRKKELIFSQGSFEPCIRDIDPTVVIKKDRNIPKTRINVNGIYNNFAMENERWLKDFTDIPDIKKLINLPMDKNKWVLLDGHYNWSEPTMLGRKKFEYPQKDFWIMIKSYIVKANKFNSMVEKLKNVNFMGRWMPECSEHSPLFNKEYFCSSAFDYFKEDYYGGTKWKKVNRNNQKILGEVMVPVEKFFRDRGNDYSTENGFGWYKPCEDIFRELGLKYGAENSALYDTNNNLICFDTNELCNEELGFLIDKDSLRTFLNNNDYKIFWTVLGEKRIIGDDIIGGGKVYPMPTFSGVYYETNLELEGKITVFME
jgi:hypothetical protein